ncbi:MAG: nucleotidyltransferase domain-containing protein [Ignavibacteriae bacterium]|nr:nucleotidyltransferase domain-containing protein [Ignavibacteriota bacterium]
MQSLNQILNFLEKHKLHFSKNYNVSKLGVFGSYVKGLENKDSDLDIILEFYDGTENLYEIKQDIKKYLESNLNMKVDI